MYFARTTSERPLREVAKLLRSSQVHCNWISGSNNDPNIIYTQYHFRLVLTTTTGLHWRPRHLATPHSLYPTSERGCHGVGSTPGTIQCDLGWENYCKHPITPWSIFLPLEALSCFQLHQRLARRSPGVCRWFPENLEEIATFILCRKSNYPLELGDVVRV